MDPLIHTVIATGLIAIAFYYGVYRGVKLGFNKGIEEALSYMDDEQLVSICEEINKRKSES